MRPGVAFSLLRRHGPRRLASLVRELAEEHGVKGAMRLVSGRLSEPGGARGITPGPIADLADVQRVPVRSTVLRGGRLVMIGTTDLLQCKKYRLLQKQEMLERVNGSHPPIVDYREVHRWLTLLQTADRVLVYRMPDGPEFQRLLAEAERLDIELCYDIDDPVFDPETVRQNPNLPHLSTAIQRSLLKDADLFSAAMRHCRRISVSTEGLRDLVLLRFPDADCHVVPNGYDAETMHFGAVGATDHAAVSNTFRVLLPSGSLAHAADTAMAVEGLMRFLERRPETEVVTIGHFDPRSPLHALPRVRTLPYLAYSEYMRVLGTSAASLVPLADGGFNACKSIVRLIDATAVGVPVIASPVGEYGSPTLRDTFLAARSPAEWSEALDRLAADPAEGRTIVAAARARVCEARRLDQVHGRLDLSLRGFLGGRTAWPEARALP